MTIITTNSRMLEDAGCQQTSQNQRHHEKHNWKKVMSVLEELSAEAPTERPHVNGDIDNPKPWLEAYTAGVGSPLELKFLREFEKNGFHPQKQIPVPDAEHSISIADFAVPEKRLAIYIDGAAFHVRERKRRDRWIREKLRNGSPPWTAVELRAGDL